MMPMEVEEVIPTQELYVTFLHRETVLSILAYLLRFTPEFNKLL